MVLSRLLRGGCGLFGIGGGVLPAEPLDAAGGIHQLLLAGKEGVAGSADFKDNGTLVGGAGVELVSAGAFDVRGFVVGMNSGLGHLVSF